MWRRRIIAVAFVLATACGARQTSAQTVANFVTMTPCRIADTRDTRYNPYNLGTPAMVARSTRDFNILASPCGVPSTAIAYSFNITVVPHGQLPYLTIWPTGIPRPEVSTLNSYGGAVTANGAVVPAGSGGKVSIYVDGETDVLIDINGYMTQYVAPTSTTIQQITQQVTQQITQSVALPTILAQSNGGTQSLAVGNGASSVGTQNTAIGYNALAVVSDGIGNNALGANALANNVSGSNNVGIGSSALKLSASGSSNIAIGSNTLLNSLIVSNNSAVGTEAMFSNVTGSNNTAVGMQSLFGLNSGSRNVAIGYRAGYNATGDDNIDIGNVGANETATIRIGTEGTQNRTFIAGILGNIIPSGGSYVLIDGSGRLGIQSSSRRYKEDINDIPADESTLMKLRPVQFRYKKPAADGSKPLQYGLIAEEVNEVDPNLVIRKPSGEIEGVRYDQLPALLLQQIQRQQKTIEQLERRLHALEAQPVSH